MKPCVWFRSTASASALFACLAAGAQTAPVMSGVGSSSGEQAEADDRVIAARCGTPAFEKAFYKDSQAAVRAGLVSKTRPPADVEKTITTLRRSPFVLVTAPADCADQMIRLKEVQKARKTALAGAGKRGPHSTQTPQAAQARSAQKS